VTAAYLRSYDCWPSAVVNYDIIPNVCA
jgi:hypothetical protein